MIEGRVFAMCGAIGATTQTMPAAGGCGSHGAATSAGGATDATGSAGQAHQGYGALGAMSPHQHGAGGAAEGAHGKHVHRRTAPEDRGRARRNLDAVMQVFGDLRRDQVSFKKPGATHGHLSDAQKAEFRRRFPGLPVPNAVVFPAKGGGKPVGVVYGGKQAPDLGMGNSHTHGSSKHYMQHIWFTPNDLDFAFSDTEGGAARRANQIVNQSVNGGGGTK